MPSGKLRLALHGDPSRRRQPRGCPTSSLRPTELSKNITTPQTTLQAISIPTISRLPAFPKLPGAKPTVTNEFSYRNSFTKTLPYLPTHCVSIPSLPLLWAVSYSSYGPNRRSTDTRLTVYCGGNLGKLSYPISVRRPNSVGSYHAPPP